MKKFISIVLVLALILSLGVTAFAAEDKNVTITYREIKILINGERINPKDATGASTEPFILDGSTFLPVRAVAGALGLEVGWDAETSTVYLDSGAEPTLPTGTPAASNGNKKATITYRDIKIVIDGNEIVPTDATGAKVEPFILNGTTYLPVRAVSGALGLEVGWDAETSTVTLVDTNDESGVKGISLNETSISYKPGNTFKLVATVSPSDAADKTVTWSSSDESVATVSSTGLVTMVKVGNAIITAKTVNGRTAKCEVVVQPIEATGIRLNKTSISKDIGGTEKLTATISPSNVSDTTVTWSSSNTAVATVDASGNVKAVGYGSAVITAKTGNVSATCSVLVEEKPLYTFSGSGDDVITGINIPKGIYICTYTHKGNSNFIADLYYGSGRTDYNLIANDLYNCSGTKLINQALRSSISDGMIEVSADGQWTIEICRLSGTTTTNLSGNGDAVVGFFTATKSGRFVCKYSNNGDSNIIVDLREKGTTSYQLAVNDIGPCSGSKTINLVAGRQYFFEINADGDWTIDLGMGDPVTYVPKPSVSSTPSSPSYPSTPSAPDSGDDGKYSYTDASNLNNYATKATEATNKALTYCNQAYGSGIEGSIYANYAIDYVGQSMDYLEMVISILENHVPLTLSGSEYATLLDMAQASYDLLDTIDEMKYDSSNYKSIIGDVAGTIGTAGGLNLKIQKCSVDLMEAFLS